MQVEIDKILRGGPKDIVWVQDENLWPSEWGLPKQETDRILAERIVLSFLFSPTTVVDFPPPNCVGDDPVPFVFVDATLIADNHIKLSREELIAIILHEFGHKLNPNTPNAEYAADDYARLFKFGKHLANALVKLKDSGRPFSDVANFDCRIERVRNHEPLLLCHRLKEGVTKDFITNSC